jgi:hypothetical protein
MKMHTILQGKHYFNGKLHDVSYYISMVNEVKTNPPSTVFSAYSKHSPCILNVKVNGKPKTWKTRPDNVEVPIKYGLYEYNRVCYKDGVPEDEGLYFVTIVE